MNYTKGEWEVKRKKPKEAKFFDNFTLLVQSETLVIALCDRELWDKHKERLANANLIAAAPDMYEELLIADEVICNLCKRLNPQHEDCVNCGARDQRLQAVAKAEGKDNAIKS